MNPTTTTPVGSYQYDLARGQAAGTSNSIDPYTVSVSNGGLQTNPNFVNKSLSAPTNINYTPNLSASDLSKGVTPIVSPPSSPSTADMASQAVNGISQGLHNSLQPLIQQQNDQVNTAQGSVNAVQQRLAQLEQTYAGKGAAQIQAENDANLPSLYKTANDLSTEYQTSQLAYNNQYNSILNRQGITAEEAGQQISSIQKQNSLDSTNLSIRQALAQNQYNTAQTLVNHKIDLQFGDLKDLIGFQQQTLKDNQDTLSKAQQNKLQLQIESNTREYTAGVTAAKQLEDTKLSTLQEAYKNGAPQSIQAAIQKANTPEEAIGAAGKYIGLLDREKTQADIAKTNAEAYKARIGSSSSSNSTSNSGGITPELAASINRGDIDPNLINSRTLPIYNAIAKAGIDAVGSHSGAKGETAAITDLSKYKSTATRTLGVIDKNLPLVANLADKVNQTGVPGLDSYIQGVKSYTGNNTDVIRYVNSLKTLRSEYAQMLSKGSVATEGDKTEAANAIPSGLSGDAYRALGEQLKLEANNIIGSSNDAISSAKSKSASNNSVSNNTSNDPLGLFK